MDGSMWLWLLLEGISLIIQQLQQLTKIQDFIRHSKLYPLSYERCGTVKLRSEMMLMMIVVEAWVELRSVCLLGMHE